MPIQNGKWIPEDAIAQGYKQADRLSNQNWAPNIYGNIAAGLGAVGGNILRGSAQNGLLSNQDMRSGAIRDAAAAPDNASMAKLLMDKGVPGLDEMGFKMLAEDRQSEADANKPYRIRAAQALQYGFKKGSPEFNNFVLAGKMPEVRDPLDDEYKRAQINALNNKTVDQNTPQYRATIATQFGMEPGTDAYKSYVLTGKLPREDQLTLTATDKKAILEADEAVAANKAGLEGLKQAQGLNDKAYDGTLASQRAWLVNNFVPWATPDAEATVNFDNALVAQALPQMKAIFGGNPTEGERKILLDLQGASNQPVNVRREIMARAVRAADARLKFNEDRAASLRGGTFYKPKTDTAQDAAGANPLEEARAAIAAGAPREAVIERLRQNGISPEGL